MNSVRRMREAWVKRQFLCRIVADLSFHRYGSSIHAETHVVSGLVAGSGFLAKALRFCFPKLIARHTQQRLKRVVFLVLIG